MGGVWLSEGAMGNYMFMISETLLCRKSPNGMSSRRQFLVFLEVVRRRMGRFRMVLLLDDSFLSYILLIDLSSYERGIEDL